MRSVREILPFDDVERLNAYRRTLDRVVPDAVQQVLLFGSRARGDAQPDSDYDIAVLVRKDLAQWDDIREAVFDAAYEHILNGFFFAPVALPEDYLEPIDGRYQTELARRIAREGAVVS
jgi:predicted nucleotidyltransferase